MGVVFAAQHRELDQNVAIKFLLPHALAVPDVVARFAREARAAAKIQSEHVARVIDVGTLEDGARRTWSWSTCEGHDLPTSSLDDAGTLAVARRRATTCSQACEALAAGARPRHRPPRSQAGEPLPRPDAGTAADRQGARLRHLEDASRREGDAQITNTSSVMGSPHVHVARADAVVQERRRADGHLGARRHPLRAARRAAALRRRDARPRSSPKIVQNQPSPPTSVRAGNPAGARGGHAALHAHQG